MSFKRFSERRLTSPTPHLPLYHLRPERNWINDALGLTKADGKHHLFFQYNPLGPDPGIKHWGHAATTDLVHWEILPVALSPTPNGPDEAGCWSGSITNLINPPHLFYTGVTHDARHGRTEAICLATGESELRVWRKHSDVLIPGPPNDLDTVGFRDPFVWLDGDQWSLLVGSGIRGGGGAILVYRSKDLLNWRYDGVFFSMASGAGGDDVGAMWECPQLIHLGDYHVLLLSIDNAVHPVLYVVGHVVGGRFSAERIGRLDMGPDFYAPTCDVEGGRAVLIAWSPEARSSDAQVAAGWAGVMTLPRDLTLGVDGQLCSSPVAELSRLRKEHWSAVSILLPGDGIGVPMPVGGSVFEVIATVRVGGASVIGLRIRKSPDGREVTTFSVDPRTGGVIFDRSASSLAPDTMHTVHETRDGWPPGERIKLHLFADESIVELFIDDTVAVTGRIYPTRTESLGISAFAIGGNAEVESIDIWQLDAAVPRDLGMRDSL